jgi:hypothetical protein
LSAASSPFEVAEVIAFEAKDDIGEPRGEAGMLERLDGPAQGVSVLARDFCGFLQRQVSTGSFGRPKRTIGR